MIKEWNGEKHKANTRNWTIDKLHKAGFMVERDGKILCPVLTGRLRASIAISVDASNLVARVKAGGEVDESQVTKAAGRAMAGTLVNYAPFVELGTHKMEAQPFLRPALEKNRQAIKALFGAR